MTTKGTRNQNREQPSVATLSLCLVYQLLADVRRPEISIMPTTDGNYAIVVRSKAGESDGRNEGVAIVPHNSLLAIGQVLNDVSADGYAEVEIFSELGLGGDGMLAELLLAVADVGWSERGFGDTIAAIKGLKSACFRPFIEYLKPLHLRDLLVELEERI